MTSTSASAASDSDKSWRYQRTAGFTWLFKRSWLAVCFSGGSIAGHWYVKQYRQDLSAPQRTALTICSATYTARMFATFFYINRTRPVPIHEVVGFTFLGPLLYLLPLYFAKPSTNHNPNTKLSLSLALVCAGHLLTLCSELQRKWFKQRAENKGKLYTRGLNSLSRHPNYLGDVLLFSGWSLLTNQWWMLLLPASMLVQFYAAVIPELEGYLQQRYAAEWPAYAKTVKALIPFVY